MSDEPMTAHTHEPAVCPKCWAIKISDGTILDAWECDSVRDNRKDGEGFIQSAICRITELERTVAEKERENAELRQRLDRQEQEVESIIGYMPQEFVVRVCEGGGPENVIASLAVSTSKMKDEIEELRQRLEAAEKERDLLVECLHNYDVTSFNFPKPHILSGLTNWCDEDNREWWSLLPDGQGYQSVLDCIRAALAPKEPRT